jgi:hypothetical protein
MLVFERHTSFLFLYFRAGASLYTELSCCALLHKVLTALAYMHEQVLKLFRSCFSSIKLRQQFVMSMSTITRIF